jgi:hypothetical protein
MITYLLAANFIFIFILIYQIHKIKERLKEHTFRLICHDDSFTATAKFVELATEQIKYCRYKIDGDSTDEVIQ